VPKTPVFQAQLGLSIGDAFSDEFSQTIPGNPLQNSLEELLLCNLIIF